MKKGQKVTVRGKEGIIDNFLDNGYIVVDFGLTEMFCTEEEIEVVIEEEIEVVIEEEIKNNNLTEKELKVLKAMQNNTFEIGLPVETSDIKEETGYSKRSIVGVLSSLYKKGFVEKYDYELDNEFMLSEKGYESEVLK